MLKVQDLKTKLDHALMDTYKVIKSAQLHNNLQNYKFWCFLDKFDNIYWAVTNGNPNGNGFNINVFKTKTDDLLFSYNKLIAETVCSFKEIDGKKTCFIDSIWVKHAKDQGKGLGSKQLELMQLVAISNGVNELSGCLKAFTDDKTPSDLRAFYKNKGFKVIPHKNTNQKTATIRKEILQSELNLIKENTFSVQKNELTFNVVAPTGLKQQLQTMFQQQEQAATL